jgi:legumain
MTVCHSAKNFVLILLDIANNTENPFPGTIINYPKGPNVYKDVLKDYTGDDVNPTNFLNILSGNATAMKGIGSGKVIASTKDDKVFVYFSDHGATDLIAFPNDYLYADDLMKTLKSMAGKQVSLRSTSTHLVSLKNWYST